MAGHETKLVRSPQRQLGYVMGAIKARRQRSCVTLCARAFVCLLCVRTLVNCAVCRSVCILCCASERLCVKAFIYCVVCQSVCVLCCVSDRLCTVLCMRAFVYCVACQSVCVLCCV